LGSSLLQFLDDFFPAVRGVGKLVLNLGLLAIKLFSLFGVDAFDLLLMFLIVSLSFFLYASPE